jgi:ferric-dicitrate binding protein FerR (iron transport regulator)
MGDDYLWDRSGEPDPEVERLERALGALKYVEKPAPLAEASADKAPSPPIPIQRARSRLSIGARFGLLAAAAALSLVGGFWVFARGPSPWGSEVAGPKLAVQRLSGAPQVASAPIGETGMLGVGQWLETDPSSRAKITIADIGQVVVSAGSRVRLTATGPEQHRLDLERGVISAHVLAPPRLFVVGTPAATAVDLGCDYTLEVDAQGAGTLHVTWGWVSLEHPPRSSLVPARASCRTRPGLGPGTPSFDDAPIPLRDALERFDFEGGGAASVEVVLELARPRDAISVWHLLPRVDAALRKRVYERLRELAPPPASVDEPEVLRLDPPTLDRWQKNFSITW